MNNIIIECKCKFKLSKIEQINKQQQNKENDAEKVANINFRFNLINVRKYSQSN